MDEERLTSPGSIGKVFQNEWIYVSDGEETLEKGRTPRSTRRKLTITNDSSMESKLPRLQTLDDGAELV